MHIIVKYYSYNSLLFFTNSISAFTRTSSKVKSLSNFPFSNTIFNSSWNEEKYTFTVVRTVKLIFSQWLASPLKFVPNTFYFTNANLKHLVFFWFTLNSTWEVSFHCPSKEVVWHFVWYSWGWYCLCIYHNYTLLSAPIPSSTVLYPPSAVFSKVNRPFLDFFPWSVIGFLNTFT